MPGVCSLGNGVREIVTSGGERERRRARTPDNFDRARICSPLYQGARLLIHVHTPFTPFYSVSFLLKEMRV